MKKALIGIQFNYDFTNKSGKYTVQVQIIDQLGDSYNSKSLNFEVYTSKMTKPVIASTNSYITNNSTIQQQNAVFNTLDSTDVVSYEWRVNSSSGTRIFYTPTISLSPISIGANTIQVTTTDIYNDSLTSDVFKVNVESPMQSPVIVTNPNISSGDMIAQKNMTFSLSSNAGIKQYLWTVTGPSGTNTYTTPTISYNPLPEGIYSLNVMISDNYGNQLSTQNFTFKVHQHTAACYVHMHTAACYTIHHHSGDSVNGGGCYTNYVQPVTCGQPLSLSPTHSIINYTYPNGGQFLSDCEVYVCPYGHQTQRQVYWFYVFFDMYGVTQGHMDYPPAPVPMYCPYVITAGHYELSCGKVEGQSYLTCGKTEDLTLICGYK